MLRASSCHASPLYLADLMHFPTAVFRQVGPNAPVSRPHYPDCEAPSAWPHWNMICENVPYADIEQAQSGTVSSEPVWS